MTPLCRICGQPLDTPKARCRHCGAGALIDGEEFEAPDADKRQTPLAIGVPLFFFGLGVIAFFLTPTSESDWFGLGKLVAAAIPITIGCLISLSYFSNARQAKEPSNLVASLIARASIWWLGLIVFAFLLRGCALISK